MKRNKRSLSQLPSMFTFSSNLACDFFCSFFFSSPIMQKLYSAAGGAPGGAGSAGGAPSGGSFPGASQDGPSVEEVD